MEEVLSLLSRNGLWLMIIAVVFISHWFSYRHKELKTHHEMRMREIEHQRKMKELEVELEKAKARQVSERLQQ